MTENTHSVEKVMNIGNYESIRWQGGGKTAKAAVKALREMEALITPEMVMNENQAAREKLAGSPKAKVKVAVQKQPTVSKEEGSDDDF